MSVSWARAKPIQFRTILQTAAIQSAANRNQLQERVAEPCAKPDDAKGRFKRLLRSANNHQAEMKNAGENKQPDGDDNGTRIIKTSERIPSRPSSADVGFRGCRTNGPNAQQKVVKKIDNAAHASADDGVNERFSEAAFALHSRECFGRFSQNHD